MFILPSFAVFVFTGHLRRGAMTNQIDALAVQFRGHTYQVPYDPGRTTCTMFIAALQHAVPGLAVETLKVLVSKPKAHNLQLAEQPNLLLAHAGITPGGKLMLLGSFVSELQAVHGNEQAASALRLPDFDHEATRLAQRSSRRRGNTADGLQGRHCFGSFQVLPLPAGAPPSAPSPSAALTLLHRIATDPAIVRVMTTHSWQVGLLSEMPPEGKVGVSAVCVLGYNVNKGQEISLRLRTDDYRGFRKYLRIRETLVHELAHMVHSDHDYDFKTLNSQLLKEVSAHEAAAAGGRTLSGAGVFDDDWLGQQQDDAAAQARQGRALGGARTAAPSYSTAAVREAAAAAALERWQQQQHKQRETSAHRQGATPAVVTAAAAAAAAAEIGVNAGGSGVEAVSSGPIPARVMDQVMEDASHTEEGAVGSAGSPRGASPVPAYSPAAGGLSSDDRVTDDPATAAAEEAMRRLGSLDERLQPQTYSIAQPQQQQQQQQQQQSEPVCQHVTQLQENQQQRDMQDLSDRRYQQQQQQHTMLEPDATNSLQHAQQQSSGPQQVFVDSSPRHEALPHALAVPEAQPGSRSQHGVVGSVSPPGDLPGPGTHNFEAGAEATDDQMAAFGMLDDVVGYKLQQVQVLLQQLQQQASISSQQAVQAVEGVLFSVIQHPNESKYRRLRCSNPAFIRQLGQYPAAMQLLLLAGFAERQVAVNAGGAPEPVLMYVRDDPGLLWLVLSALRDETQ